MAANGKDDRTAGASTASGEPLAGLLVQGLSNERYLVAFPDAKNRYSYFFNVLRHGFIAQTTAPDAVYAEIDNSLTWEERLSVSLMSILPMLKGPTSALRKTIIVSGGVFRTLSRLISRLGSSTLFGEKGSVVVPNHESATSISKEDTSAPLLVNDTSSSTTTISSTSDSLIENDGSSYKYTSEGIFADPCKGDRSILYTMVSAASLAYSTEEQVKEIVTNDWKMNFVGMYNCWNETQQAVRQREVFVFTDKAQDANAIVVSWRGTDPLNVDDWWTNLDFSWFDLGYMGAVHIGFLEALGLADRHDMNTFVQLRKNLSLERENNSTTKGNQESTGNIKPTPAASGLSQDTINAPEKILAYDYISELVKDLLEKNPNARLFITGHSLGGALALLFTGLLYFCREQAVTDRIAGLYTVGQPRVGNEQFAQFMLGTLSAERYFRVVYRNDLVARLPFDNPLWRFKHWGICCYFTTYYKYQMVNDVPDPNYFNVWYQLGMSVDAIEGLVSSKAALADRLIAFFLPIIGPGIGDHGVDNYETALRLGNPMPLVP